MLRPQSVGLLTTDIVHLTDLTTAPAGVVQERVQRRTQVHRQVSRFHETGSEEAEQQRGQLEPDRIQSVHELRPTLRLRVVMALNRYLSGNIIYLLPVERAFAYSFILVSK